MSEAEFENLSDEQLFDKLKEGGNLEKIVLSDEQLCNAVVERYIDELACAPHVPVVRGYCALRVLPRPKTLEDAKRIVDGN